MFPLGERKYIRWDAPGVEEIPPNAKADILAMKIFGVEGDKFDSDSETHTPTQDIESNSTPALDLADAKTTKEIFALRVKYGYDTEEMDRQMRARDNTELQKARFQVPNKHLDCTTFYSQTAYRFGEYVMKFSLAPVSEAQKRRANEEVDAKTQEDGIVHEWLREYFRENEAVYEFRVQLLENLKEQPVEYGGAEWD